MMRSILFATTNSLKVNGANAACNPFDIALVAKPLDLIEIQANNGEPVARDKAEKAFAALQEPVVVTDDSWTIPGLQGFPGAYMKDVSQWFTVDDWLNLTRPLADRRIILRQFIVFQDKLGQQLFVSDLEGVLLPESRGAYAKNPSMAIVSFDSEKTSAAERITEHGHFRLKQSTSWQDFARWYQQKVKI